MCISKEEKKKMNKDLGNRLRNVMREQGYKNEDLMQVLDYLSIQQVRNLLSGQHGLYNYQIEKIASDWKIRIEYLQGKDEFMTEEQKVNYEYHEDINDLIAELRFLKILGIQVTPVYYWKANMDEIERYIDDLSDFIDDDELDKINQFIERKKNKVRVMPDYLISFNDYWKVLKVNNGGTFEQKIFNTKAEIQNILEYEATKESVCSYTERTESEGETDTSFIIEIDPKNNIDTNDTGNYYYFKLKDKPKEGILSNLDSLSKKWSNWIYKKSPNAKLEYFVGIGFETYIDNKRLLLEHGEFFKMLSLIEANAKSLVQFQYRDFDDRMTDIKIS